MSKYSEALITDAADVAIQQIRACGVFELETQGGTPKDENGTREDDAREDRTREDAAREDITRRHGTGGDREKASIAPMRSNLIYL